LPSPQMSAKQVRQEIACWLWEAAEVRCVAADRHQRRRETRGLELPRMQDADGDTIPWQVTSVITHDRRCYEVGPLISWGAYSDVHVAMRRGDETVWAAKHLYVDDQIDDDSWPRRAEHRRMEVHNLRHECEALCALGALQDAVWLDNGQVYLFMDLAATDIDRLERRLGPRVSSSAARELGRAFVEEAAGDLTTLHASGYVHLDFKPENVLLMHDGSARVSDFGLAVPCGPQGVTLSAARGSACFIAPEVLRERRAYHASDVFSLSLAWMERCAGGPKGNPFELYLRERWGYAFDDFFARRAALLTRDRDGQPRIAWERVPARDGDLWDAYFRAAKRLDPKLGERVILHGLHPDPLKRWPAARLRDYARDLRDLHVDLARLDIGKAVKGLAKLIGRWQMRYAVDRQTAIGKDPYMRAIITGLRHFIDATR
ncbi:MAG TPA: protein kinase, partial [Myxococcota bacterium]|nr:protein kinase [Myxococcota bacterium]